MIDRIINAIPYGIIGLLLSYILMLMESNKLLRQTIEILRKELREVLRRRDNNV